MQNKHLQTKFSFGNYYSILFKLQQKKYHQFGWNNKDLLQFSAFGETNKKIPLKMISFLVVIAKVQRKQLLEVKYDTIMLLSFFFLFYIHEYTFLKTKLFEIIFVINLQVCLDHLYVKTATFGKIDVFCVFLTFSDKSL